jgi:hypothetical protein
MAPRSFAPAWWHGDLERAQARLERAGSMTISSPSWPGLDETGTENAR